MKTLPLLPLVMALVCIDASAANELALQRLVTFGSEEETQPRSFIRGSDGHFYGTTSGRFATSNTVFRMSAAGEVTTVASLAPVLGSHGCCAGALVQAPDGSFYGATSGRAPEYGAIYHLTTKGALSTIFTFGGTNGSGARVLIFGGDGKLYGTTSDGGPPRQGTVFRLTPEGHFTSLFSFSRTNGINPTSLVRASDGSLFGTTSDWIGINAPDTVFKLSPAGELTTLVSSFNSEILRPWSLVLGSDGALYGVNATPDTNSFGTIFKVTSDGALSTLAEFNGTNGWFPNYLVQANDGNFYGMTAAGGDGYIGRVPTEDGWIASGSGTVFKLAVNGELTVLASLNGISSDDVVGLIGDSAGVLYGAFTSDDSVPSGIFRLVPRPMITAVERLTRADILRWSSFGGALYSLEYAATLGPASWSALSPTIAATGNTTSVTNDAGNSGHRYYRVRLLP